MFLLPVEKLSYSPLDITFLVDENLNNYKEIHDWLLGLGFPQNYTQFQNLQTDGQDRFSSLTRSTANVNRQSKVPLKER